MNETFTNGIKTIVVGMILIVTSIIIQNYFTPTLTSTEITNETILSMGKMIPIMCNILRITSMMMIVMGVLKIVNGFRDGGYYEYDSDNLYITTKYDDENDLDENDFVPNETMLISMDEKLLNYKEEFLEENEKKEEEIQRLIEEEKDKKYYNIEEDSDEDEVTYKKIRPKNDSKPQMIKCSFCGREKEMGSVCKRCKKC